MIRLLFPFKNPMKLATLIFGGTLLICVHDQGIPLLLIGLLPSSRIVLSVFSLFLLAFLHKIFFYGTLVQKQYDFCSSISYVLNFYCHSSLNVLLLMSLAVARLQETSKGVFLSLSTLKLFPLHRHSRWLLIKKTACRRVVRRLFTAL